MVPGILIRVQETVQKFMAIASFHGRPNVMDRLVRMLKYGREVRNTTKGPARIAWEGEVIMVDEVKFSMPDLKMTVHGLLATCWRRMRIDLMRLGEEDKKGQELPSLELRNLQDSPGEMREGFSFLTLQSNQWSVDGSSWLAQRLLRYIGRPQGSKGFLLNQDAVKEWVSQLRKFKEELFVLVHLTGGAPARGTEIVSIKCQNGPDGRIGRGIFLDRGL
ncbi:hypothetical protein BDZ85DRAFT_208831, partial [Elsinoe ampelina]